MKKFVVLTLALVYPTFAQIDYITQVINKPIIDARTFNVKCNGTQDDTAPIQNALNAAHYTNWPGRTFGAIVQLPTGTCRITTPIIGRSAVDMVGQGAFSTTIKADAEFTGAAGIIMDTDPDNAPSSPLHGFKVRMLQIDMSSVSGGVGIKAQAPQEFSEIRDVQIYNAKKYLVYIGDGVQNFRINGFTGFLDDNAESGNAGILIEDSDSHVEIHDTTLFGCLGNIRSDCYTNNNAEDGIRTIRAQGVFLSGNHFEVWDNALHVVSQSVVHAQSLDGAPTITTLVKIDSGNGQYVNLVDLRSGGVTNIVEDLQSGYTIPRLGQFVLGYYISELNGTRILTNSGISSVASKVAQFQLQNGSMYGGVNNGFSLSPFGATAQGKIALGANNSNVMYGTQQDGWTSRTHGMGNAKYAGGLNFGGGGFTQSPSDWWLVGGAESNGASVSWASTLGATGFLGIGSRVYAFSNPAGGTPGSSLSPANQWSWYEDGFQLIPKLTLPTCVNGKVGTLQVDISAPKHVFTYCGVDGNSFKNQTLSTVPTNSFITATATLNNSDQLVFANMVSGAYTINLPPTPPEGQRLTIKHDGTTTALTVAGNGNTIDGGVSFILNTAYSVRSLIFTATNKWSIIGN